MCLLYNVPVIQRWKMSFLKHRVINRKMDDIRYMREHPFETATVVCGLCFLMVLLEWGPRDTTPHWIPSAARCRAMAELQCAYQQLLQSQIENYEHMAASFYNMSLAITLSIDRVRERIIYNKLVQSIADDSNEMCYRPSNPFVFILSLQQSVGLLYDSPVGAPAMNAVVIH